MKKNIKLRIIIFFTSVTFFSSPDVICCQDNNKNVLVKSNNQDSVDNCLWNSIALSGPTLFDMNAMYRIKLFNNDGTVGSGWHYPVVISPALIFLHVNTVQFSCGAITAHNKYRWYYKKQDDCEHASKGYEYYEWHVADIQILSLK